jgi:hypothetical protein
MPIYIIYQRLYLELKDPPFAWHLRSQRLASRSDFASSVHGHLMNPTLGALLGWKKWVEKWYPAYFPYPIMWFLDVFRQ